MADFKDLIDSIRKEHVTLFLGSGFSRKAGAPMASAIIEALYEALPQDVKCECENQKLLDVISQEYEEIYGREELIQTLEKIMSFIPTDTSDHTSLTKVPHIHHIITTNYDTLIEDAYGNDNCYVVRTSDDLASLPQNKTIIYKIHGDFKAKDHILITKQDYTRYFDENKEPLLWKYIQAHILTNDILFIGYSLEDTNVFSLIQEIHRATKNDSRKYFLIAPGLRAHKIDKLAKTRIRYFDAKAEELFPILFETLDKKIKTDYQRKHISLDTFSRYSRQHYLHPIVKEGIDCNQILKFDCEGKSDIKINLSGLSKEIAEKIQNHDVSAYDSYLPNTHIPALKLTSDMLKDMNISINGLTTGDIEDYQSILISPVVEPISTSIKIPTRNFNEKVKLQKFNQNKEHVCYLLETEAYTIKLIFYFLPDKVLNCTCNVNLRDEVQDIQQAIKWMNLVIALWNQETVIIKKFTQIPLKFPVKNGHELKQFEHAKRYFENILEIEDLYDVEFESIVAYSEELYRVSELLIHSQKESLLSEKVHEQECTIDFGEEQEFSLDLAEIGSQACSLALSQYGQECVEFNGQSFEIKRRNTIIPSCIILDVKKVKDKVLQVRFKITSEYILVKYTNQDFAEMKEFSNYKTISR